MAKGLIEVGESLASEDAAEQVVEHHLGALLSHLLLQVVHLLVVLCIKPTVPPEHL